MNRRTALAALFVLISALPVAAQWQFVVAGDSRNCGDVVMPAIAASIKKLNPTFYWHLGDFRVGTSFDEDMADEAKLANKTLSITGYQRGAWPDFIRNQVDPFAPVPVYLSIGNHELVGKTRLEYVAQFADWLAKPDIRQQRLADDPADHTVRPYFHWIVQGTDFISLDNASSDMFDDAQVTWLEKVLKADQANPAVHSIVVGMHAALPHSLACDHSMNDYPQGAASGERVYRDLLAAQKGGKFVYVLASHSHFVMSDVFASDYWKREGVLPGWIIGTAGAVRYRLPATAAPASVKKTDVYGFLLATVAANGSIAWEFREVTRADVPADVAKRYTPQLLDYCFADNREVNQLTPKVKDCDKPAPCTPSAP